MKVEVRVGNPWLDRLMLLVQVAGLTNNSNAEGADLIRRCVSQNPELGHQVLYVAKVSAFALP